MSARSAPKARGRLLAYTGIGSVSPGRVHGLDTLAQRVHRREPTRSQPVASLRLDFGRSPAGQALAPASTAPPTATVCPARAPGREDRWCAYPLYPDARPDQRPDRGRALDLPGRNQSELHGALYRGVDRGKVVERNDARAEISS
jgi:hypothetical protein